MMPGRQASPGHVGRLRRSGPLIRIESGGMKQIRRRGGIAPFAILECSHVEMQEHAETQIHKPLLQIEKSAARGRAMGLILRRSWAAMTSQHCGGCSLGG